MANGFVAHAILLACKGDGRKGGGLEIGKGAREGVKRTGANTELEVFEAEQRIQSVVGDAEIFARTEKEIKPKTRHSETACAKGRESCAAKLTTWVNSVSGSGLTREGGSSTFAHAW